MIRLIKLKATTEFCYCRNNPRYWVIETVEAHKSRRQNLRLPNFKTSVIWKFKQLRANSVDPDVVARNEPPHLDLHWFQIELFSSWLLLGLTRHN